MYTIHAFTAPMKCAIMKIFLSICIGSGSCRIKAGRAIMHGTENVIPEASTICRAYSSQATLVPRCTATAY